MKTWLALFFLVILAQEAEAQYPKHIIQFRDKNSTAFTLANPGQYLSPRALQRRNRYNITIDSTDLPVVQRYVDSLRVAGNVVILSTSKWLNQVLIQTTDQAALTKIRNLSFVKSSTPIGLKITNVTRDRFKETIEPAIPSLVQRTMLDSINYGNNYNQVHIHEGEYLHNKNLLGQTMLITVLDAGFQQYKNITAFDSMRNNNQVLGERDYVAFDNSVNEDDSHGMFCLSTMAANWPGKMVGTAHKARYYLVRTENASSEYPIEEHNWVAGAEFADSVGSDMISSSLGYYDFDDASFNHTYADLYKNTTMVSKGASLAAKKGIIVMNSAGNEGNNAWRYIAFPADADSVCAVGATDNSGNIAAFSSHGYPGKVKPNIVSVGSGTVIAGFNNLPVSGSGTSFANPNVAGLIACLWQAFPQYNNMKILDAVYRSSNRFAAPTNRFGYGIPNFKTAYRLLRKDQNTEQFGNEWFFATPNPFTIRIDVKFIGRIDGPATIQLLNSSGAVVATKTLATEMEELYNFSFTNLGAVPGGDYTVKYTDATTTYSVSVKKVITQTSLLEVAPNPFSNNLSVTLLPSETGKISLRLVDAIGRTMEVVQINTVQNQLMAVAFTTISKLAKGMYTLHYSSASQQKSIKLLKQ